MVLEIGCPCALLFGYAATSGGLVQVGVALQHPPTQLYVQPAAAFSVTGARADIAHAAAGSFGAVGAQVEVELATPALMGLASEPLLALSLGRGLTWSAGQPAAAPVLAAALRLAPEHALAVGAFAQGGALVVAPPAAPGAFGPPLRRHALEHADRAAAWAWVLYLPALPPDAPLSVEPERAATLHAAAAARTPADSELLDMRLWPALEHDDLPAFGAALRELHAANAALLPPLPRGRVSDDLLDVMAASGAAAWGQALAGHALFAVVRGAQAAVALRAALLARLPLGAGRVLITIADIAGAGDVARAERPLLP
ncbi:MAG: hypothetical protein IT317_08535 [Anaerolineales bacterium]|nr:hypothetical protein [Anaerolineales bacterium]